MTTSLGPTPSNVERPSTTASGGRSRRSARQRTTAQATRRRVMGSAFDPTVAVSGAPPAPLVSPITRPPRLHHSAVVNALKSSSDQPVSFRAITTLPSRACPAGLRSLLARAHGCIDAPCAAAPSAPRIPGAVLGKKSNTHGQALLRAGSLTLAFSKRGLAVRARPSPTRSRPPLSEVATPTRRRLVSPSSPCRQLLAPSHCGDVRRRRRPRPRDPLGPKPDPLCRGPFGLLGVRPRRGKNGIHGSASRVSSPPSASERFASVPRPEPEPSARPERSATRHVVGRYGERDPPPCPLGPLTARPNHRHRLLPV